MTDYNDGNWRPIETAPKDGRLFLACNVEPTWQIPACIYWERGSAAFNIDGHWRTSFHETIGDGRFTHWIPLPPEPPIAKAEVTK